MDIQKREPVVFAAGDSLIFQRHLVEFPASDYKLDYTIYSAAGAATGVTFSSAAAADGSNDHLVRVMECAKDLAAGEYILAGFVVGLTGNPPERHQVYRSELQIQADLPAGAAVAPEQWFESKMVDLLQQGLTRIYQNELQETDVQRVKIVRARREEVRQELNFWEERLQHRRAQAAGRSNVIRPVFNIA